MSKNLPIFVYGTLRSGEGNYAWALQGRTDSEQVATLDAAIMYDNNGGFPFVTLVNGVPGVGVVGDLMTVPDDLYDAVVNDLDGLEGYYGPDYPGNMYDRQIVTVTTEDGTKVKAYTYLVAERLREGRVQHLPVVEDGDWVKHDAAARRGWNTYA